MEEFQMEEKKDQDHLYKGSARGDMSFCNLKELEEKKRNHYF